MARRHPPDAPVAGRVCHTGVRLVPRSASVRISLHATVQPQGVLGWLPYLLLRVQLVRVATGFLKDLQYYVEHGRPSPRKQRQLDTAKR